MEEMERWRLSVAFAAHCAFLKWKLRLGLQPFSGFTLLSDMATNIARQLEAATTRIAETAVRGSEPSATGHENIGGLYAASFLRFPFVSRSRMLPSAEALSRRTAMAARFGNWRRDEANS